jgi:hypothetical protein
MRKIKAKKPVHKKARKKKPLLKKKVVAKKKPLVKKKPRSKKKPLIKGAKAAALAIPGIVVGKATHYFPKVRAAVVKVKSPLAVGDTIRVKGHTTDFTQAVTSMQIDHVVVALAKKGAEIGMLVSSRVRQGDVVYKI